MAKLPTNEQREGGNMNTSELMDLTKVCRCFPANPPAEIMRDSFLDAIDNLFESHTMVVVEGPEGIGKTTLLSQFCRRHSMNSISVFINTITRSSYDTDIIRLDLCNQLNWIITQKELDDSDAIDTKTFLGKRRWDLHGKARTYKKKYFFVVDGLSEIPDEDSQYRELILDMLPLGESNEFKFLIAGDPTKLPQKIIQKLSYKSYTVSGFTIDEIHQYLSELDVTREDVKYLYNITKNPGQYASIRRILQTGITAKELLDDLPAKFPNMFEIEWRQVDTKNAELMKVLALLVFARIDLSIDDVARISRVNVEIVSDYFAKLGFITDHKQCSLRFVSEQFRKYVEKQLFRYKEEIDNLIIDDLRSRPDSPISVTSLPMLLDQSGKYNELLSYLTPQSFLQMMIADQSLIPLKDTAYLGVNAAYKLRRDGDLIGFSLQGAIIDELLRSDIWESEINALISVNQYQAALGLVERATTKEDRLYLLSILAKVGTKDQFDFENLTEKINSLAHQIESQKLGEKAIDIAANLLDILPEIAFELVEKSADTNEGDNALDWAFAKLSIKAIAKSSYDSSSSDIVEKIRDKIKDPKAKSFSTKAYISHTSFPAIQIIAEAEKIEKASERLFIVRSWLTNNREDPDASIVLEYALKEAISTTMYSPNARDYREMASPLPFIDDCEKQKRLVSILDSQKGTIEALGPIEDYVRLLLTLALAENKYDSESSSNRLLETYLYIRQLDDLGTKTSCLARLASILIEIDPEKGFESKDKIHSLTGGELDKNISKLLGNTADQYLVTKGIIRAMAKALPEKALATALELNGVDRRNYAIRGMLSSILQLPDDKLDLAFVKKCFEAFTAKMIQDDALVEILARASGIEHLDGRQIGLAMYFMGCIPAINDASIRCNALSLGLNLIPKLPAEKTIHLPEQYIAKLSESWENIDVGWVRVDVGFKIVEALANSPDRALEFLQKVEEYRDGLSLESDASSLAYLACLRLCVRAFSGLFDKRLDNDNDLRRLLRAVNNVPSKAEQIGVLSELALRFKLNNRQDQFVDVVTAHIKPRLQQMGQEDLEVRHIAIIWAAPALYLCHQSSALALIREQPINVRDKACHVICTYILNKTVTADPYDTNRKKPNKLSYDEVIDIITLLNEIDYDSFVASLIDKLVDSIDAWRNSFTQQQKAEIGRLLDVIIEGKFPNDKYIKHEGYKIISRAQLYRIRQANLSDWNDLLERAKKIENISDRIFILATIAKAWPHRENENRKSIIEDAALLIGSIPSEHDQIARYEVTASLAAEIDITLAKKLIRLGMDVATKSDSPDAYSAQRRFIDFAYKLDEELAASLASLADNDPAREKSKDNLRKRYETLQLKGKISEAEKQEENTQNYPQAAWMLLAALNAKRVSPLHFEKIREFAQTAAKMPFSESYPIFAWIIQNGIEMYQKTDQAAEYLKPVFEATLSGCELILSIAQKSLDQMKKGKLSLSITNDDSVIIENNDQEEAKQRLTEWLRAKLGEYLIIADGYFGLDELWILQTIKTFKPNCNVQILTSKNHLDQSKIQQPWDDAYREYWKLQISDQDPPPTEIVIVGIKSTGKSPIHDRWWLTDEAGLRIGTSLNDLGDSRISEISYLSKEESQDREQLVLRYVEKKDREFSGEKLLYSSFTL